MNKIIDLRSDTVTHPTGEMRSKIAKAELGDDVFNKLSSGIAVLF